MPRPRLLLLVAVAALAAPLRAADDALDPATLVQGALRAAAGNDLAGWYAGLPEAQRSALAGGAAVRPAADEGAPPGERSPAGMRNRMRPGGPPLALLASPGIEAQLGAVFAGLIAQAAAAAGPEGAKAPASPAIGGDQPMLAMLPRLLGPQLVAAAPQRFLAAGLETRQIAAWQGLLGGFAAWAGSARLDDLALAAKAQTHLAALAKAQPKPDGEQTVAAQLAALSAALPHLKAALAVYGLDLEGALARASATVESQQGDQAVVVVAFTAFGADHALPLRLARSAGAWRVVADSPALRWLRGGPPGMMGGRPGGPPGGGPGRQRRQDPVPPEEPEQPKPGQKEF